MSLLQAYVIQILLIHSSIAANTYEISYEPNGEIVWTSTSDFSPLQSQPYGTIRLGQVMSIEFDFVYEGRISSFANQFFRIGAAATSEGCDAENSKYPAMFLKFGPSSAILDVQFTSGASSCALSNYLTGYGDLNVNAAHHIKISLDNTNVAITITGGGPGNPDPYTESWPRDRTPKAVLGSDVSVWWMGDTYTDFYDPGQGTFSNIIIKTNIFTFAPTMAPSQPSTPPTSNPTTEPTTNPTVYPTTNPTQSPSNNPSESPLTAAPTTGAPTNEPTVEPTVNPTMEPTINPTIIPTENPTINPSKTPTTASLDPSITPSENPSINPSINPTVTPTIYPTVNPIINPTINPSLNPSITPTDNPSATPTDNPSTNPSIIPTNTPLEAPLLSTASPTAAIGGAQTAKDNSLAMVEIVIIGASIVAVMVACCIICGLVILYKKKKADKPDPDGPASPIIVKRMRFENEMAARPGAQRPDDSESDGDSDGNPQIVVEEEEEEESDYAKQTNGAGTGVAPGEVEGDYEDTEEIGGGSDGIVYDDEKNEEQNDTSHGDKFENEDAEQEDTYYEDEYYDDDEDEDESDGDQTRK